MKSVIFFVVLSVAIACAMADCDPDSDNKPTCSSDNLNKPIRNFHDPCHYWLCLAEGDGATAVSCPISHGFDSDKGECVHFDSWLWTAPCPEVRN